MKKGIYFWIHMVCITFGTGGCVESYIPNLKGGPEDIYVVSGELTDKPGYQTVTVSKASSVREQKYIPLSGCLVSIEDDEGHVFTLEEYGAGKYEVWMDQEYLRSGISYRSRIATPSGDEIISDYDRMPPCPGIDSVYYERKELITQNTGQTRTGLQFYVDFHGKDTDSRYYRWSAVETWEYHTAYPKIDYYDGDFHKIWPPDYTEHVCWSTLPVKRIFTLSTDKLISNSYKMMPVQFVDNTTNRLFIGYSVLITQYALSAPAYVFWEQLRINSIEQGGLYEKQPLSVEGNVHNITHPENKVLGFFGASSVTQKRIFVNGIHDMGVIDGYYCDPHPLGNAGWAEFTPEDYPVYYTYFGLEVRILDNICVDCQELGGSLIKPDFWPN
jgi:hypothetical protein